MAGITFGASAGVAQEIKTLVAYKNNKQLSDGPNMQMYLTQTGDLAVAGSLGYGTGAGGAVTQATSKSTGVTLSTICGAITMNAASLAATTTVGFTLTNTLIAATDVVVVSIKSGATANSYHLQVAATAAGTCLIELRNVTGGALAEAVVINFAIMKATAS